jgi:RNase adapter protein RapZ
VAAYVLDREESQEFLAKVEDLCRFLFPRYQKEGKAYLTVALGCTGGKHRSVALVEALAKTLAADGWQVSIRHRDLEQASSDVASGVGVGIA